MFTLSPNMSLPIATVGNEPGPNYAFDVNSSLTLVDQHDHSPGKGVQITPSGLNINSALTLNGNFLTDVAGVTLNPQSSPPSVNTLYESGVDLFWVDGVGNNVRITQSGAVAGTPGSIANLVPPASASYVAGSKTFVWQSGTNIAANMDAASYIFRNISPNSTFGITVQPPALLGSNWSLTLPPIPLVNGFMQLDTSGVITAPVPISHGITNANIALGMQIDAVIQNVTTTDTVGFTTNIVNASVASPYTLTTYSAVGNGQTIRIRKTSDDFNVLTVSLVGASTSTTTLDTFREEIEITSNGSDWIIVSRTIPSRWGANTSFTVSGGFGGISTQNNYIRREGDSLHCRVFITFSSTSAAVGYIGLPSSLTPDTAKITNSVTMLGQWVTMVGGAPYAAAPYRIGPVVYDGTGITISSNALGSTAMQSATANSFVGAGQSIAMDFVIPISGWNS